MHEKILDFWFKDLDPKQWWEVNADFDALLKLRFLPLLEQAATDGLAEWRASARGRLAEIIVLDQFSRNIFRGTARAFAQDALALTCSQEAVAAAALNELDQNQRTFLLMPYMHSESREVHAEAQRLFKQWTPPYNHDFELKHKAIVDRFGRYPHRNAVLGRESTPEELEFLKLPGSAF